MVGKIKKLEKRQIAIISLVIILAITSLLVYNKVARADTAANKVAISNFSIIGIDTGTSVFDTIDIADPSKVSDIDVADTGYIAGNDHNAQNRLVRSFDKLIYHFDFGIEGKAAGYPYEERTVNVKVILSDEEAKYVAFDDKSTGGETSHVFAFSGLDTYGNYKKDITLYVLGAPNGMKIHPKFEIQESTNTDSNYVVTLGKMSDTTTYY